MTVFTNSSEKGVTERRKLSPVIQIAKRKFPALAHKKSCREPEINKLTVLLKGVNCYRDDSGARHMRLGEQMEVPNPQPKSTLGRSAQQHSVFAGRFKENEPVSKDTEVNGKAKLQRHKEKQRGVQNFVLKSRSFPTVKPLKMSQADDQSKIQHSAEEPDRMARDAVEQEYRIPEQEESSTAVRLKGREKSQSLAMVCSILEGHKISFKTKREKATPEDSMKHNRPSDRTPRYSTRDQLPFMHRAQNAGVSITQTSQKLKLPSACICVGYESWEGVQKDGQVNTPCTLHKDAKKCSKFEHFSTDDDDSRGELVARSKCSVQRNDGVLQNATIHTKRMSTKLVEGVCQGHCTTSEGGFLCLTASQPKRPSQRDRKNLSKQKSRPQQRKSTASTHHGRETLTQTGHKEIDSLLPRKSDKEQNDALIIDDDQNQKMMQPSNEAPTLSPVLEKRETFQLPKVETYEISPRSILDSKACSVFSKEKKQKHLRRNSGGEWMHKRKAGVLRPSVFNSRVNQQRRVTIRQPSPVAGVKISVKDHEDILVNTALQAVEKCNIPPIHEEIPPPVKKFVIRLPPVC